MSKVAFFLVFASCLLILGCSNSAFYYPSKLNELNPDISWFKSKSGNEIAYLWLNSEVEPVRGIVVHFHGNNGHMEATREKVDWLVKHGYHILVFDYSGFGHSSGQANDRDIYLDAISILELTVGLKAINELPTFIVATSTGGNIFLRAWADYQVDIDGVIIDSSFTSYTEVAEFVVAQGPLGHLYSWVSGIFVRDDYAAQSVMGQLPEAKTLVIHCAFDQVVPISLGEKLYEQLKGDKVFWRFENCHHARAMTNDFPENQMLLLQWLEETTFIRKVISEEKRTS